MAIFCVVFGHVEVYSEGNLGGFFYRLQSIFCMPLFFFLSGLFAKPQYDLKDSFLCIKKKFSQLMIPFLVCGSLYVYLIMPNKPWWILFVGGHAHCGFWFLLVLFEIFLLFTLCQIISRKFSKDLSGRSFFVMAIIIESILAIVYILCLTGIVIQDPWYKATSFVKLLYYFPFFIMGYFFMRNQEKLTLKFNNLVYTISSVIFVVLYVIYDKYHIHLLPFQWILALLAMVSIISLFRSFEEHFSNNKKYINIIESIGRNTLEIYVLHYFFIPRNMKYLKDIIIPNNLIDTNVVIELAINSSIACVTIAVTLCCAFLINKNLFLKKILFGKIS